jgi:hypothetical protein
MHIYIYIYKQLQNAIVWDVAVAAQIEESGQHPLVGLFFPTNFQGQWSLQFA